MTSRFSRLAALGIVGALISGLFIAAPAGAGTVYMSVKSSNVAISSGGSGKVYVKCYASTTCRGYIWFEGEVAKKKSYAVAARSSGYVAVALTPGGPNDPATHGSLMPGGYKSNPGVRLWVQESSPKSFKHGYTVTLETVVTGRVISGQVTGVAPLATNVKVRLVTILKGGNTSYRESDVIPNGGTYAFGVTLGTNNSPTASYRLRISGYDQDGEFRSWYWRGSNGNQSGGGKFLREASAVSATKSGNFDADFNYGTISGNVQVNGGAAIEGAKVTVAAPPAFYGDSADNRELDINGCANILGETVADGAGNYKANFLPYSPGESDKRYMVMAKPKFSSSDLTPLWNDEYGSCFDAMDYERSRTNLISLHTDGSETRDFDMRESSNFVEVNGDYSGFTPTAGDRWIRIRERIPGYSVLACPIVAEGLGNSSGIRNFAGLPPGEYHVEIGRRTVSNGVVDRQMWYSSRYSNNIAYFKGEERAAERWKTVAGKYAESSKSYAMGYVATTPPSGRKGWMYRTHIRATGAGYIAPMIISGMASSQEVRRTVPKGASIRGHLSRSGGRTNKEMLIRVSSSDGKKVLRTALTDGSGNFQITGLASGSYSISVNSDSWRGIGRAFTGKHSISVSAGKSYSVGTLYFLS